MDAMEIKIFIDSINTLLGNKEVHIAPVFFGHHKLDEYLNKGIENSINDVTGRNYALYERGYNIESLKISHTSRKAKFNLRRKTNSSSVIRTVVIPLPLVLRKDIAKTIKDELHGRDVVSITFFSRLLISETKQDDDMYIRPINILGHKLYVHLGIDTLQRCEFNYEGFRISIPKALKSNNNELETVKSSFAKIPKHTKKDGRTSSITKSEKLQFKYVGPDSQIGELCDNILEELSRPI